MALRAHATPQRDVAAPAMLRATPHVAAIAVRASVTPAPCRSRPRLSAIAPKSNSYPTGRSEILRKRLLEPLQRQFIQASILLHPGNDFVEFIPQTRLALLCTHMRG